jgi:hypothetical protein
VISALKTRAIPVPEHACAFGLTPDAALRYETFNFSSGNRALDRALEPAHVSEFPMGDDPW